MIYHTGNDIHVRNSIFDLYLEQMFADEYSDHLMSSMMEIFFVYLTRIYQKTSEVSKNHHKSTPYDDQIINYIRLHYSSVTLASLAADFHVSVSCCSRLIRTITGQSFSEILTKVRMQEAANLLLKTPLSVLAVSIQLGYENPETFIRAFKKEHSKLTPTQYRQKYFDKL